jgi:hypothetical protein
MRETLNAPFLCTRLTLSIAYKLLETYGGDDETRTRDLCRDRTPKTSTYYNLQDPDGTLKHRQNSTRQTYCVPDDITRYLVALYDFTVL